MPKLSLTLSDAVLYRVSLRKPEVKAPRCPMARCHAAVLSG